MNVFLINQMRAAYCALHWFKDLFLGYHIRGVILSVGTLNIFFPPRSIENSETKPSIIICRACNNRYKRLWTHPIARVDKCSASLRIWMPASKILFLKPGNVMLTRKSLLKTKAQCNFRNLLLDWAYSVGWTLHIRFVVWCESYILYTYYILHTLIAFAVKSLLYCMI